MYFFCVCVQYIHYLETVKSVTPSEMRNVYERACNIHLKDKIKPHLSWAVFEEESSKYICLSKVLIFWAPLFWIL